MLTFVSPLASPHSLLLTSPGFLDSFKKKKHLPQAKHSAGHSSGPVAASPHPGLWAPPCLRACPAPLVHPTLKPVGDCSASRSPWATVTGQVPRQAGKIR